MKSITLAAQDIMLGNYDVVVAGGFESMSNVPYYLDKGRTGYRLGHGQIVDGIIKDGLWDVYDNVHMGSAGERCAEKYGFSREEQDKFAINSYRRSADATKNGRLKDEIVPISIPQKKGNPVVVSEDEEYQKIDLSKVASLKPAFEPQGTITAANASTLNDGGCAVILMNADVAKKRGVKILGYIRGFADAEQAPLDFTTTPALATPLALERAGVKQSDIDYWEINEAFSVVVLANTKLLGLDPERVNVDGGAVSLGHPIGMSGARLVTHLVHLLAQRNARFGSASICNGGGGATAIVIERA
jgi:acetyl-CoA C-acetyltransferase